MLDGISMLVGKILEIAGPKTHFPWFNFNSKCIFGLFLLFLNQKTHSHIDLTKSKENIWSNKSMLVGKTFQKTNKRAARLLESLEYLDRHVKVELFI